MTSAGLSDSELRRARLTKSAAFASIAVALVLIGLKGWATVITGSAAMLGSLADTALDLLASLVTLLGVWIAAQPADRNHRFGHGKAEAIAGIVQTVLIALSAFTILIRSAQQWIDGTRVAAPTEGIGVSAIAIALTFVLLAWQRHVIRQTGSVAISTDNVHYQSDLFLNLAVIGALGLDAYFGIDGADPVIGIGIAAWLAFGAWRAAGDAVDHLMDREWPEEKRQRFVAVAARHEELSNLHDLRTRSAGNRDFVQFHVDLPPAMTIAEAHDVIEEVEQDLLDHFPGIELLIHIDPKGHVDEPGNPLVEEDQFAALEKKEEEPK